MSGVAHLVGGMAFETGEEAMRAVAEHAGDVVDWVPDGETGPRRKWMSQHRARFDAQPALQLKAVSAAPGATPEVRGARHGAGIALYGLAAGKNAEDVDIETFGYVEPALESYRLFAALKQEGLFAPKTRFLVAIPSPSGIQIAFVHPQDRAALEPVIEGALFADVAAIAEAVPSDELAIQWDVATEFAMLSGLSPTEDEDPLDSVTQRLARAGDAVPAGMALGYHLCYGAAYDVHFVEPEDTALMAQVMAGLLGRVKRPIDRFHIPVPIARDDLTYFKALRDVDFGSTELYLGLLHHEDGLDGARRRITAAKQVIQNFGVGTECGTGRSLADPIEVLQLHTQAASVATQPPDPTISVPNDPRPQPPRDLAAINTRLRQVSEQVPCPECGAETGQPCLGDDATELSRPHMDRYHDALLGTVKGRLPRLPN